MKAIHFRRPVLVLLRVLTICAALAMIPFVILVSALLPWKPVVVLLLFVVPCLVVVIWAVRALLRGPLRRRESPVRFYAVLAIGALSWLVVGDAVANVFLIRNNAYLRRMNPARLAALTTGVVNDVALAESQKKGGLFSNERQKRQLYSDYARFYLSVFFPFLGDAKNIPVLDYHVGCFDYFDTGALFQEIFLEQQYFFRSPVQSPLIIDCGSHIGMSILYFKALYPRARVLGFEPAPDTFRLLSENVARNRLKDVRLVNKAVSNETGKLEFYGDRSKTSSLLKERGAQQGTLVDVVKLSDYIDGEVDFLKLDVEGVEDRVLQDLAAAGKIERIGQMIIEYHHHIPRDADRLAEFLKVLEDHGFGYQIGGGAQPPYVRMESQDVMIYAYRK